MKIRTKEEKLSYAIDCLAKASNEREMLDAVRWALVHVINEMKPKKANIGVETTPETATKEVSVSTVTSRE